MPLFGTDEPLWYNVGVWGELGYACPNFGNDYSTLNGSIAYLVDVIGRNLSAVMHHTDADLRVPPSINTLMRVHKLIVRGRAIMAARAIPAATPRMESVHATPAAQDFRIFPIPFFRVRNAWMKEWAGYILSAISEACQHTENRNANDISTAFSGLIGQYLQRVYVRMATELLQVPRADAEKPDFTIADTVFAAYDPTKWFTATELIDTNRVPYIIPTEDDLRPLTDGIPASLLVGLQRFPRAEPTPLQQEGSAGTMTPAPVGLGAGGTGTTGASATTTTSAGGAAFAPPPGP